MGCTGVNSLGLYDSVSFKTGQLMLQVGPYKDYCVRLYQDFRLCVRTMMVLGAFGMGKLEVSSPVWLIAGSTGPDPVDVPV